MSATAKPRPLGVYRPALDMAVFVLGLLGILVVVHLWIQTGRGFDRGCFGFSESTSVAECEVVATSDAGKMFGVSNVFWGLLYYLGLTALSFATVLIGSERVGRVKRLRAVAIAAGLLYSAYLFYIQAAQIGEFCVLCLISAGIVAALFLLQVADLRMPQKQGASEAPAPGRARLFSALAIGLIVVAGADVLYFRSVPLTKIQPEAGAGSPSGELSAADATGTDQCHYDPSKPIVENYRDLVSFGDPSKGNPDSPVTVIEFFDPNCPHCATLHPIMEQLVAKYSDRAWFVWRPFVLWPYSVPQVEAMYFAAQDGKFFEMMGEQFRRQRQGGIPIDELGEIASLIGLDGELMKTRVSRGLYRNIIVRQRETGVQAGVTSVPAVMINGRFVRTKTLDCLGQLIEAAR